MKKILLLMAIFLPLVLISCGDDKDEPSPLEQKLIGSWTGGIGGGMGSTISPEIYSYTFNANHTGKYTFEIQGPQPKRGGYDFKWSLKGNTMTIKPEGEDYSSSYEISIENDILIIKTGGIGGIFYELHRTQE